MLFRSTIERLSAKLGSLVQAGGRNFSTGQAQRLLMARALVRGSQFLFLDEALSSLDEENRHHIYRHVVLGERYRNVTMVMVSHDPSLIDYCDTAWFMMDRETFEKIPGGRARAGSITGSPPAPATPRRALEEPEDLLRSLTADMNSWQNQH